MRLLVVGGAGYVGSEVVRHLFYSRPDLQINVLDTFWYWNSPDDFRKYILVGDNSKKNCRLSLFPGDIRKVSDIMTAMRGCDQVINLACISNDPSSDLDQETTVDVNLWGVANVIDVAQILNVERFIHASSSSVYGVKEEEKVTEDLKTEPLTLYSKLKVSVDKELEDIKGEFNYVVLRPATVCGHSGRQRLDLVLNIFAYQAAIKKEITVHGGGQFRPNINIMDMVNAYEFILEHELHPINGQVYNVGDHNHTLLDLALMTKEIAKTQFKIDVKVNIEESTDQRSYRLDSTKIQDLGFRCVHGIPLAIESVMRAALWNHWDITKSSNIEVMKKVLAA